MLLSSGTLVVLTFIVSGVDHPYSTQETLDEGVEKLRSIYKTFEQVGIKDRSMIWNSSVASPFSFSSQCSCHSTQ